MEDNDFGLYKMYLEIVVRLMPYLALRPGSCLTNQNHNKQGS
jgi:hypothetical protein